MRAYNRPAVRLKALGKTILSWCFIMNDNFNNDCQNLLRMFVVVVFFSIPVYFLLLFYFLFIFFYFFIFLIFCVLHSNFWRFMTSIQNAVCEHPNIHYPKNLYVMGEAEIMKLFYREPNMRHLLEVFLFVLWHTGSCDNRSCIYLKFSFLPNGNTFAS